MPVANTSLRLNPPIQYSLIWLIIGLLIIGLVLMWLAIVFWLTRRRPFQAAAISQIPTGEELARLKNKYLQIVDSIYDRYLKKEISKRQMHGELSMAIRYFVYEASHIRAPIMTLGDIEKTSYQTLSQLISDYYPKEFSKHLPGQDKVSVDS